MRMEIINYILRVWNWRQLIAVISQVSTLYRLLSDILLAGLTPFVNEIIYHQCWYHRSGSHILQIFAFDYGKKWKKLEMWWINTSYIYTSKKKLRFGCKGRTVNTWRKSGSCLWWWCSFVREESKYRKEYWERFTTF